MPIDIRLTAIPAPGSISLAAHLAATTGEADGEDIVVAVQGAETAGLDPYLGGPVAGVLAASEASSEAAAIAPVAIRVGDTVRRLLFIGLGDESAAHLRKAGAALGRRAAPERGMLVAAMLGKPAASVRAFAEGMLLGSYRFSLASGAASHGPSEVRMLVTTDLIRGSRVGLARSLSQMARASVFLPSVR